MKYILSVEDLFCVVYVAKKKEAILFGKFQAFSDLSIIKD